MKSLKIDLHTHSILSSDGGLREHDYQEVLDKHRLDVVAVTDHNQIEFGLALHRQLGEKIIVGEEIRSSDGEIIGLFLEKEIKAGLSARETVRLIKKQDGVVLIPHPFETLRQGISASVLREIVLNVDCIEVFNSRSLQPGKRTLAWEFVKKYGFAPSCNSDSHCRIGIGRTYSEIAAIPTAESLKKLLIAGERREMAAPWLAYLCPKVNILRKMVLGWENRDI